MNSECFFLEKQREFTKENPNSRIAPIFVNYRCLSRKNTPNSRKQPKFANRLANRPFFGLGLPGRLLSFFHRFLAFFPWDKGLTISLAAEYQEKTPCADSACADCPGFLVVGAADARTPSFVQEPQAVSLD